ncbi:cysteinyl-tRNA synthetase [Coemansia sp. RSA 1843]|nr:cysteinyl-tRNA synthetase [Coemansia sp. RSA 1843]
MSGDHKKTGLKGKLRAFSSTGHLRDLVRSHAVTSGPSDATGEPSHTPPLPPTPHQKDSMQSLRHAGSTIPQKLNKDVPTSPKSSYHSGSSTSKWFKRGRHRNTDRKKEKQPSDYQLDMNFSDIGNFVDMSKVRRPSVTSSMGTTESMPMNVGNVVYDSGRKSGSNPSIHPPTDSASVYSVERPRKGSSSGAYLQHKSQASSNSPMLKEAIPLDARSIASSIFGGKVRGSSAGSAMNTEPSSYRSESLPWSGDYSWQHRDASVKSRKPTTVTDEGESSEHGQSPSLNDHNSARSVPVSGDRQQLAHFTDPWVADRNNRNPSITQTVAPISYRGFGIAQVDYDDQSSSEHGKELGSIPGVEYPPRRSEPWAPPESWAVLPTAHDGVDESGVLTGGIKEPISDDEGVSSDSDVEEDTSMYSMRIYKEDSTFGTFHCRLSTTTAEFMQMAAKKFFIPDITRHCLYMQKANGLDRTLNPNERPANILKKYLEQMGYRPEDNITLQGREDNSYLCKFSLFKAVIPRVSPNMEVEVKSFHYIDLRARKLQTVPVFLYAHANKILALNMSKNPGLNFPADFVQLCDSLRELRLATCQFSRFPNSIQYFPHLSFLDLSGNDITRMAHAPLNKLTQLCTLMLRNNRLVDLPDSLAELKSLRVLNVSNNDLPLFPPVIAKIAALEELDISFNRIPEIPDSISSLAELIKLNVMGNSLTGSLPTGLCRLSKLEELDVRQNRLQDFGVTSDLPGLKLLYTERNIVTRAHMDFTCATYVSLKSNKLTQCHITNPAHTLVFLDLSHNQLTELPTDIFMNLPMLEHLILDSNHIVSLPSSVGNLSNLVHLSCTNNILSLIPIELTRLENLNILDLHNNNLKLLPPEIWLMPKLAVLNLSSNLLEQFPHPSMLETLRRQQGGSSSVRTVAAAAAAAAAAAQRNGTRLPISGKVAQSIQLSSLSMPTSRQSSPLVRASSEIPTGQPANSSDDSTGKAVTDKVRNRSADAGRPSLLNPPVPMKRYSISDPPPLSLSLKELRLGDNNLDDEVFTLMAFLPELRVLNLSYNELYDLQPSAMAHMRKIVEIYLSGTQISTIPEEEPSAVFWRGLRVLNINGNKLQTLPSWLAKINGLSVLDVGSNVLKYNITNWPYDWNWNWNTGLKYLNFSYNERFEIKGAHLHTKVFHEHASLVENASTSGPARDLFNYITKEPPKSDCVSDFYQLTDLRILGLVQLTIMVPLPDETPNRRIRTTDQIKQVKYGIADTLGSEDRVSTWDLATSRFRMAEDECLFGLFHARETWASSSAISKYLCDKFLYIFRDELDKIADQMHNEVPEPRNAHGAGNREEATKSVNFAGTAAGSAEDSHNATKLSNKQVHAALRRTFLTLNKDIGTHNRQLVAAAAAAEAYVARTTRMPGPGAVGDHGTDSYALGSTELNSSSHGGSFAPKGADIAGAEHQGGSTAVVAYIHGRTLHVSNVGDALGVVSRRGTPVLLSKRHDPYDISEIKRIRSIGGYITQQGKVQGQTDITRAFGYFNLLPYVNADPTINTLELAEEDEFLIMANKPVWDVITPQIAVDIARKHRRDPRLAAARVRDHVIAYGVTKSIMVMVIGFGPMFTKNSGRPMRGFSVRDSIYPGISDHRAKYAMSRRMSRSPSTAMPPTFGSRASLSHQAGTDGKGIAGIHVIPGAHQNPASLASQQGPYDFMDDVDEFSPMSSMRTRRQRDRDVGTRLGDSTLARLEREVPPPVGEVALVFTDVKNSTVQWESNPVAMRSAIKVHNSIMRRMLRSIGGYEVKTEGDAFMVSFPTVASALHWSLAVQMTFLTADWPQEILDSPHGCPIYWPPDDDSNRDEGTSRKSGAHGEGEAKHLIYRGLRVRIGMHFGSPVSEEDPITRRMDYFGPMVNRASRISGAADGGQVYVSQDVMDEVYAILNLFETADHNNITDMRQLIDEPSLARDVQALRNLGLSAVQVGEIKLKGLESAEFVSHVYPAAQRGRIDMQIQEQQQKQQQQSKRKKQDWSKRESAGGTGSSKYSKQMGGKGASASEGHALPLSNGHRYRRSIDEGSLRSSSEAASVYSTSSLSTPRDSFSKQGAAPQTQRLIREPSADIGSSSSTDIRNRARQAAEYAFWSTPLSRRSVSLLQNHAIGPDHLESIGEDSDGTVYRPIQGMPALQEVPYNSSDRAVLRGPQAVSGMQSSMRPSFYLSPSYYPFLYGPSGTATAWSRQGSFSYFAGPSTVSGYPSQGSMTGGRQLSRGSVDTAMAIRSANGNGSTYIGSGSSASSGVLPSVDSRASDVMQIDALFKLTYRLNILATEPDAYTVLPSFEYFVAHQADDLASYRIHRASTVSIASVPYPPQLQTNSQPIPENRSALLANDEHALSSSILRRDGTDKRPSITTYPISPGTQSAAESISSVDSGREARARSTSPLLVQPALLHSEPLPHRHRHTRSVSPEVSTTPLVGTLPDSSHDYAMRSGSHGLPLQPALNEPPTPLFLSEAMSQQHLISILAMIVRQFECAVDSLEAHVDDSNHIIASHPDARNDSKMDERILGAGAALRYALEQVANNSCSLEDSGFEWTQEHVLSALEFYAKHTKK